MFIYFTHFTAFFLVVFIFPKLSAKHVLHTSFDYIEADEDEQKKHDADRPSAADETKKEDLQVVTDDYTNYYYYDYHSHRLSSWQIAIICVVCICSPLTIIVMVLLCCCCCGCSQCLTDSFRRHSRHSHSTH
ncbi:uncharacterized protein LOC142353454 [Convolutriloba macropyga]|uniref:uncharacterized protein LOC142353454 n=1 Tax=Convolutriloba macropyga TaxID=536237 RepID=UPI003F51ACAD